MSTAIAHRLDLSVKQCHVCGRRLSRDQIAEKEWCTHFECSAHGVRFSIPYIVPIGKDIANTDVRVITEPSKDSERLKPIFAPIDGHGVCRSCGEKKPWDEFRTNKTWSHGKASICKECAKIAKEEGRRQRRELGVRVT